MANLSALAFLICMAASPSDAQSMQEFLARLDQFAKNFTGARASIRTINHVAGLPEDEIDGGTFLMKRSGGKAQIRIDFTGVNAYTVVIGEQSAEIYHPKLNEIQVYDLRAYKDVAQKFFLLGFGMSGRELAANYEISGLKNEAVDSQAATYVHLVPKSADVLKQLKSVDIWISDSTHCPVRQIFRFPDGGSRTANFSNLQVNPKIPGDAFELPKSAKRVRVN